MSYSVIQGSTAVCPAGVGGRQEAPSHTGGHTEPRGREERDGNRDLHLAVITDRHCNIVV